MFVCHCFERVRCAHNSHKVYKAVHSESESNERIFWFLMNNELCTIHCKYLVSNAAAAAVVAVAAIYRLCSTESVYTDFPFPFIKY